MNFVENDVFDKYINSYKKLPVKEKKELVEKEVEELLAVLSSLNDKYIGRNNTNILFNREILDLKKKESTEEDFVEAMFVYMYSIKELMAPLLEKIK